MKISLLKYLFKKSYKAFSLTMSFFGVLWLIVQIITFPLGEESALISFIKEYWYTFLAFCFLIAIMCCARPKFTFGSILNNRDVGIEITIGNFFKQDGSFIIGSNTTFDTRISKELISEKSIQGQFTKIFYYGNEMQLDKEISLGLQDVKSETLIGNRIGKNKKYPIGTIIKLNPKNKTVYMVAIADINEYGVAKATYDDLKKSFVDIWAFIREKGLKENLVIPVLGSGFSKLLQTRGEIIREIIKSFVASCSESIFCDKLTIVISPEDVEKYKIDTEELEKFILHVCKYASFQNNNNERTGQAI
jgi:hypothetical protein